LNIVRIKLLYQAII